MSDALKYKLHIEKRPLSPAFVICMLLALVLCMAAAPAWKHSLDTRGIQWKSQSSFYSSLGRAYAAHRHAGEYDICFLGSSITGRIPGVESGFNRWANLGIDASSAEEGVRLMLAGITPVAPYVVLETDTLFLHMKPVSKKPEEDFGDSVLYRLPCFNPMMRLSTLLWTDLRHQRFDVQDSEPYQLRPLAENAPVSRPSSWNERDEQVLQDLKRLQAEKGVKLLPVLFPNKHRKSDSWRKEKMRYLAQCLGVPYLDLNEQIDPAEPIVFSDDVHMCCQYALRVAATIYRELHR